MTPAATDPGARPAELALDGLAARHGDADLFARVSLRVAPGEIVAITGPSGVGKTTLLRIVAGLEPPEAGAVRIDGADVTRTPAHLRRVGLVFQDDQLFPHLDVAGNVAYGLRMRGTGGILGALRVGRAARGARAARDARVAEMLALVGLAHLADRSVDRLSGGEARRVAVARTLAPAPRVVLLDEPLTGLDPALHARLLADLGALLRATGTTALHVTHDLAEARALADRVVDLRARLVEEVALEEILDLRRAVLRRGTPTTDARLPEDVRPDTRHLAIRDGAVIVATSTWVRAPREGADPAEPAIQVRGMAVDDAHRGEGLGAILLDAGLARAGVDGARYAWAKARDTALGFYLGRGFEVVGEGFVEPVTRLPHHLVVRRLDR